MLPISENGHPPKDLEFVGQPIVVTEGKTSFMVNTSDKENRYTVFTLNIGTP